MGQVPFTELHGGFAFALQGWMRAQSHKPPHPYINPMANTVKVGLAIAPNFTSPEWPQAPLVGELPVATAFYPSQYPPPQPTYTPNVGYYPYCEAGVMFFDKGLVNGVIRVDTAGWTSDEFESFNGEYNFHALNPGIGLPVGIISIVFNTRPNHVWDYAFTMFSKTEAMLATNGRLPRLAVGSGSMKQISPALLTYY